MKITHFDTQTHKLRVVNEVILTEKEIEIIKLFTPPTGAAKYERVKLSLKSLLGTNFGGDGVGLYLSLKELQILQEYEDKQTREVMAELDDLGTIILRKLLA